MDTSRPEPKDWHSRGYLPHLDVPGLLQSVTFYLGDSLPKRAVEQMYENTWPDDPERLCRVGHHLDAGHGACWLRRPEIARLVEDALLHFDAVRYRLQYIENNPMKAGLVSTVADWPYGSTRRRRKN